MPFTCKKRYLLLKKLILFTNFVLKFLFKKYLQNLLLKKIYRKLLSMFLQNILYKIFFTTNFVWNTYESYNFVRNNYLRRNYLPIKILRKNSRKKSFLTNYFNKFIKKNLIIFNNILLKWSVSSTKLLY